MPRRKAHAEGDDSIMPANPGTEVAEQPAASIEDAPERGVETVTVMVLCDHVYLPRDPSGAGWQHSQDTVRVEGKTEDGRRTRIDCHPSLAKFLQDRSQAEILD